MKIYGVQNFHARLFTSVVVVILSLFKKFTTKKIKLKLSNMIFADFPFFIYYDIHVGKVNIYLLSGGRILEMIVSKQSYASWLSANNFSMRVGSKYCTRMSEKWGSQHTTHVTNTAINVNAPFTSPKRGLRKLIRRLNERKG